MVFLCALPITISSLLIAAHFYRSGIIVLAGLCLLMPVLLVLQKSWVPKVLLVFLLLSAAEWVRTLFALVIIYQAHGVSYTRLTVILLLVASFTLASALALKAKAMRRRYGRQTS